MDHTYTEFPAWRTPLMKKTEMARKQPDHAVVGTVLDDRFEHFNNDLAMLQALLAIVEYIVDYDTGEAMISADERAQRQFRFANAMTSLKERVRSTSDIIRNLDAE